jgi:hypothetical protein
MLINYNYIMKQKSKNHTKIFHTGFLCLFIFLITALSGFSQNAGISAAGATPPNAAAGLDVNFSDKGLLIPRVALTASTSPSPLTLHVAGMLVYNTVTISDVKPGLYFNNGTKWISTVLPDGAAPGMQYWDATAGIWVTIPVGIVGQKLTLTTGGIPVWE